MSSAIDSWAGDSLTGDSLDLPPRLIFFDGVCGLCSRIVQLLVRLDRKRAFRYAPLQGETADRVRARLPEFPSEIDTMVYVEEGRVSVRMTAAFRAARHLPWPWRIAWWLRGLPEWLTNPIYDFIARHRYRMFGRHDVCGIPTPAEAKLFLP